MSANSKTNKKPTTVRPLISINHQKEHRVPYYLANMLKGTVLSLNHLSGMKNGLQTTFHIHSSNFIGSKKGADSILTKNNRSLISKPNPTYVEMISKKKIEVLSIILNPLYGRFDSNPCETPRGSHNVTTTPTASHLPTTHHNTHDLKKHRHYDLPPPPASSGFNFTGEWDCRTTRNCA